MNDLGPGNFTVARRDSRRNRLSWEADSASYQAEHGRLLGGRKALAWGIWRIPEDRLQILGDVTGLRTLELGCGAAQWSIALAGSARPIGMDISFNQLSHAASDVVPLVQGDALCLPFRASSFDIVFCDYGAATFTDPHLFVPEVSRVLEPGGLLAFSTTTPFLQMCWPDGEEEATSTLHAPYFGMGRMEWSSDETVDYQLTYGDWVKVFTANHFVIEDLIEVQPPKGARTSFPGRPLSWAKKWPAEMIWRVRKAGS